MNNYRPLNLPVDLLKDFDPQDPPGWRARWGNLEHTGWAVATVNVSDYVTHDALEFLKSLGIQFSHDSLLFYGPPDSRVFIHTDGDKKPDTDSWSQMSWGINHAWGSTDHDMIWYEPKPGCNPNRGYTPENNPYTYYLDDQVTEIERCKLVAPSLARNDIPHRVINRDPENARWCISLRPICEYKTWESIVSHMDCFVLHG